MRGNTLITLVLSIISASGSVAAGPSSQVAWTQETVKLVKSGKVEKGKQLVASCAGCHGPEGISPSPMYPHLAGQRADYAYKQLRDYKDGTRANAIMGAMVASLSDQDMADIAAFYAELPLTTKAAGSSQTADVPTLVRKGDGKRLIPSCASCHQSPGNLKNHGVPILNGQPDDYLKQTMQAFKTDTRVNDVYSVMRLIAKPMTDEEIAQTASYYAGLGSN